MSDNLLPPIIQHKKRMSGTRDYKSLVTSHRLGGGPASVGGDEDMHKLAVRFMNGVQSNKYKAVDYEQLKSKAQEMKFKGNKSLIKIKQIEQASKETKAQSLLKQHKAVWMKELAHLNSLRRKHAADVDMQTKHGLETEETSHLFDDIEDYSTKLGVEVSQFKKSSVDPIWELREDLQFWIAQMSAQRKSNPDTAGEDLGSPDEIMQTILSVQQQQTQVLERLHNEQLSTEQELSKGLLGELSDPMDIRTPHTGIPSEALTLYCPHEELKVSVLQEFLLIDQKYTERLDTLDEYHADIVCYECGGWNAEEHFEFQAILDQHPFDLQHRRSIYIDRLKKQFPSKSRAELVEHEDWVLRSRNYIHKKKSLINDWYRDRKELFTKVQAVFHQAQIEQELQLAKEERTKQQRDLCNMLYDQVRSWREEKMEAMLIRQRLLDEEMRIAREQRELEEEKIKKRRAKEKEKIQAHQEKVNTEKRRQAEEDRIRLEELQRRHAEQAVVDSERVRYRELLEQQKLEMQREKRERQEQEEAEREARLEALRETVRVNAEADPYRVVKDTENWQHRRNPLRDQDFNMHQPLFDIHTYNSHQISSDPRVRLENRLRDAGVHNTDYARHVLSKTEPPKPPRKDMAHTVKLGD